MAGSPEHAFFHIVIVRFVDEHQPGFVECRFVDANGREHRVVEKVPIVTAVDLWSDSAYPRDGCVPCRVIARWRDAAGRDLVRIDTADGIETTDGLTEFVVRSEEVTEHAAWS